ncbi:hypothetical protein ACA30_04855 [Virgibacillus soli]|nr:hypothetical protein ACA30_04855 [Virgibacillus soli]
MFEFNAKIVTMKLIRFYMKKEVLTYFRKKSPLFTRVKGIAQRLGEMNFGWRKSGKGLSSVGRMF